MFVLLNQKMVIVNNQLVDSNQTLSCLKGAVTSKKIVEGINFKIIDLKKFILPRRYQRQRCVLNRALRRDRYRMYLFFVSIIKIFSSQQFMDPICLH